MHKLTMYEDLRDMLVKEVTEIEKKGTLDAQTLDNLYKLMSTIKYTDKCIDREKGGEMSMAMAYENRSYGGSYDGMSNRNGGGSNANAGGGNSRMMPWGNRSYDDSYDMGMSNARRGRDGDGDGRYSEDNFRDRSYRGRESYENSYGRYSRDTAKKKMVEKLTTLMDDTMSENERNAIMDCIDKIK